MLLLVRITKLYSFERKRCQLPGPWLGIFLVICLNILWIPEIIFKKLAFSSISKILHSKPRIILAMTKMTEINFEMTKTLRSDFDIWLKFLSEKINAAATEQWEKIELLFPFISQFLLSFGSLFEIRKSDKHTGLVITNFIYI